MQLGKYALTSDSLSTLINLCMSVTYEIYKYLINISLSSCFQIHGQNNVEINESRMARRMAARKNSLTSTKEL